MSNLLGEGRSKFDLRRKEKNATKHAAQKVASNKKSLQWCSTHQRLELHNDSHVAAACIERFHSRDQISISSW